MKDFDGVVVGAGIGGLCTAALLAKSGYRVLVLERLPFMGGRCSSLTHNGYTLTTGAVSIEGRASLEQVFDELGLSFPIRYPDPQVKYRIGGRDLVLPEKQALGFLLGEASGSSHEARRVLEGFREARVDQLQDVSVAAWLSRYTSNPGVFGVFRALCGGIFSVGLQEASMAELLRLIGARSFRAFGYPPGGNAQLAEALGGAVEHHGGTVLTKARTTSIVVDRGKAQSVRWKQAEEERTAQCLFVVSNVGVSATAELAGSKWFQPKELVRWQTMKASYTLSMEIMSDRPLTDFAGVLMLPQAKRAAFISCPTLICPELAPPGRHITTVLGPPVPSAESLDTRKELEFLYQDAKENLPGFEEHPRMMRSFRKGWPGFRARPGQSCPQETSVPNLFNVGDSVNPSGVYGVGGCAASALRLAETIRARY